MTHPLIPQILDLAKPIAENLGLEVVEIVFQTNKKPPVLRVNIRNPDTDTSLADCEQMSHALEATLDGTEIISGSYVLEISSPGISRQLSKERDFISFKGFGVVVKTHSPYENQTQWRGRLPGGDERYIYINQKGRTTSIPRSLVQTVELDDQC